MSTADDNFSLALSVDAASLRPIFAKSRRIHVPQVLEDSCAKRLFRYLEQETPWSLVLNSGDTVYDLNRVARAALGPVRERDLIGNVYDQARNSFQYLYEACRVSEDQGERAQMRNPLVRFVDFLNSSAFIEFARTLTGRADIDFADAQATCYRRGHFLNVHDDDVPVKNRVAAYVFNFTPKWVADWGGQLQFIAADGHVAEAYVPCFNALNLFMIGQPHLVSCVAPFAGADRYSVTGWLRRRS